MNITEHITVILIMLLMFASGYRLANELNKMKLVEENHHGYIRGIEELRDATIKSFKQKR